MKQRLTIKAHELQQTDVFVFKGFNTKDVYLKIRKITKLENKESKKSVVIVKTPYGSTYRYGWNDLLYVEREIKESK